jgi:hypothetical protein
MTATDDAFELAYNSNSGVRSKIQNNTAERGRIYFWLLPRIRGNWHRWIHFEQETALDLKSREKPKIWSNTEKRKNSFRTIATV